MEEKIEFIDEFLASCEDWMHGKEGDDVTKCRKYLAEVGAELKKLRVADVVGRSEQFNCGKQRVYGEEQCKKQCNDCINEYGDN